MNCLMQINFHKTLKKTKYFLFHKSIKTDDLLLLLFMLIISDNEVKRVESIIFLGFLLDEHLSWREHTRYTEN